MLSKNSTVFEPVLVRLWRAVEVFPPVFSFQWLSLPVFGELAKANAEWMPVHVPCNARVGNQQSHAKESMRAARASEREIYRR
jgi:hypothetical protein